MLWGNKHPHTLTPSQIILKKCIRDAEMRDGRAAESTSQESYTKEEIAVGG